jgi:hypothetical protein
MELEFIEKKVKDELINKPFREWNKESIHFLLRIFESPVYHSFTTINLILLNDYILWKEKNEPIQCMESQYLEEEMYSLEHLQKIYSIVNENIANQRYYNYVHMLSQFKKTTSSDTGFFFSDFIMDNIFSIIGGIILMTLYIISKFVIRNSILQRYNLESSTQPIFFQIPILQKQQQFSEPNFIDILSPSFPPPVESPPVAPPSVPVPPVKTKDEQSPSMMQNVLMNICKKIFPDIELNTNEEKKDKNMDFLFDKIKEKFFEF